MQVNLRLFSEELPLSEPESAEIQVNAEEITEQNTEEATPKTAEQELCDKVKSIRNRQRQRESGIVRLCAKRYGLQSADYDSIENAINGEITAENGRSDLVSMLRGWQSQCKGVKELYPAFDLKEALRDRRFFSLCYKGVDVKTAYEITHHDEIILAAMAYAVGEMRKAGVDFSPGYRPREGALNGGAAGIRQEAPKLTKKQRSELIKRAERGEKITL